MLQQSTMMLQVQGEQACQSACAFPSRSSLCSPPDKPTGKPIAHVVEMICPKAWADITTPTPDAF
jgi:hypothetical protein